MREPRATPAVPGSDPWVLRYEGFDPSREGLREALCALGNGVFVTRGAATEMTAGDGHYPGTYAAGGYNELASEVGGRTVVNEDLVNFPNWLRLTFRPEDGDWLDLGSVALLSYEQELDLRAGMLARRFRCRDSAGRETTVEERRLVHMQQPHLAAIDYRITPENWAGPLRVRSILDGAVTNSGVARYRQLAGRHLEPAGQGAVAPEGVYLVVRTTQSRLALAEAARTRLYRGEERLDGERLIVEDAPQVIGEELRATVATGEPLRVEKVAALYRSRDRGIGDPGLEARLAIGRAPGFEELAASHRLAWQALWRRFDLEIESAPAGDEHQHGPLGRAQLILRLHIFHLLQTVSPHTVGLDVGVPARGLHGEAYRGHVFWDELFILPFYQLRVPSITRSLLLYRYYRLDAARELARQAGFAGAMYPWQSSSGGREATQELHLNPLSGQWDPDFSRLQRHVNAAIVYNVWAYWQATGDRTFLQDYGVEMVLEIARFWASLATWSEEKGRFEIVGVMGPDEYHEKYPGSPVGGLKNNAYTNVMAVWCLVRALDILEEVGAPRRAELLAMLRIEQEELARWEKISQAMFVPLLDGGVIEQFEGYSRLEELDWESYRAKYASITRLDRILKAEGDSPDAYQVSKQADAMMLFYLFDEPELRALFERLGYPYPADMLHRNLEYYMPRTSHGSTLSTVVFASVAHQLDCERGCRLFLAALRSDIEDVQGGTTAEGIHLGAMSGTVGIVLRRYAGLSLGPEGVRLEPDLPPILPQLRFRVRWRDRWLDAHLTRDRLRLTADRDHMEPVPAWVRGRKVLVDPGEPVEVPL
jgi:trehalose/maltose hydrolase-like predicted phosphorylase